MSATAATRRSTRAALCPPPPLRPRAAPLTPRPSSRRAAELRKETMEAMLAATTTTVNAGVPPKDAEAAEKLSEIFGVKVTVETIIQYEKKETTQDKPYFVPSIEGTPLVPFDISHRDCAKKLGPRAIRRLHGVD